MSDSEKKKSFEKMKQLLEKITTYNYKEKIVEKMKYRSERRHSREVYNYYQHAFKKFNNIEKQDDLIKEIEKCLQSDFELFDLSQIIILISKIRYALGINNKDEIDAIKKDFLERAIEIEANREESRIDRSENAFSHFGGVFIHPNNDNPEDILNLLETMLLNQELVTHYQFGSYYINNITDASTRIKAIDMVLAKDKQHNFGVESLLDRLQSDDILPMLKFINEKGFIRDGTRIDQVIETISDPETAYNAFIFLISLNKKYTIDSTFVHNTLRKFPTEKRKECWEKLLKYYDFESVSSIAIEFMNKSDAFTSEEDKIDAITTIAMNITNSYDYFERMKQIWADLNDNDALKVNLIKKLSLIPVQCKGESESFKTDKIINAISHVGTIKDPDARRALIEEIINDETGFRNLIQISLSRVLFLYDSSVTNNLYSEIVLSIMSKNANQEYLSENFEAMKKECCRVIGINFASISQEIEELISSKINSIPKDDFMAISWITMSQLGPNVSPNNVTDFEKLFTVDNLKKYCTTKQAALLFYNKFLNLGNDTRSNICKKPDVVKAMIDKFKTITDIVPDVNVAILMNGIYSPFLKKESAEYIAKGRYDALSYKYQQNGFITDEVFEKVAAMIDGKTVDSLKNDCAATSNFATLLGSITYELNNSEYQNNMEKLRIFLQKFKPTEMIDIYSFRQFTKDGIAKLNIKTFNRIYNIQTDNGVCESTAKIVTEVIEFFDLFGSDAKVEERIKFIEEKNKEGFSLNKLLIGSNLVDITNYLPDEVKYSNENLAKKILASFLSLDKVSKKAILMDNTQRAVLFQYLNKATNDISIFNIDFSDIFVNKTSSLLKNEANSYIKDKKLEELYTKYMTYGFITDEVFEKVAALSDRLDIEKLKKFCSQDGPARAILEHITYMYSKKEEIDLTKLAILLEKVNIRQMIDVHTYDKMSPELMKKFKPAIYNRLASNPMFSHDENTKKALVELIAICGLFEDDPQAQARLAFVEKQIAMATNLDQIVVDQKFDITSKLPEGTNTDNLFEETTVIRYILKPGVTIPEYLAIYFPTNMNSKDYSRLKSMTGHTGKAIGNFMSPYILTTLYELPEDIEIPVELRTIISRKITEAEYEQLLNYPTNHPNQDPEKLNKIESFIVKYMPQKEKKYVLKRDVIIPEELKVILKNEMTIEDYDNVLTLDVWTGLDKVEFRDIALLQVAADFLVPFKKTDVKVYKISKKITKEQKEIIIDAVLKSTIVGRYNFDSIHRMFDGCKQEFSQDFYDFFVENQDLILRKDTNQRALSLVQKQFDTVVAKIKYDGNTDPTYEEIIQYIKAQPFENTTFGNEDFSLVVKQAGASQAGFDFYQTQILEKTRARKRTSIPRKSGEYKIEIDGVEYKVVARILRADDPENMLVGEVNRTDCCQVYHLAGQKCMEHASTSTDGGIFCVYVEEKGNLVLLTQSWVWVNENTMCFDNIEGTTIFKGSQLYHQLALQAYQLISDDIIASQDTEIDKYIEERQKVIEKSSLSPEEKQRELDKLDILKKRQTIKQVTVGSGCDDLGVTQFFKEGVKEDKTVGPKKYGGYRDSKAGQQYVISQKVNEDGTPIILSEPDEAYEQVPLYKEKRKVELSSGQGVKYYTLKRLVDMENAAHLEGMKTYSVPNGNVRTPTIVSPNALADKWDCPIEELRVLCGDDWYYVYRESDEQIEIYDLARVEPKFPEEIAEQQKEISDAFDQIIRSSITTSDNGERTIKPIKTNLREDTSYYLYLYKLQNGLLEQQGDDRVHKFDGGESKVVSPEEQKELMKKIKANRKSGNPNSDMLEHDVTFIPTEKYISRLIDSEDKGRKL